MSAAVAGADALDRLAREGRLKAGEVEMAEERGTEDELEFGTKVCVCPECGKQVPHRDRGIPCSTKKCPECGSPMKGSQCIE